MKTLTCKRIELAGPNGNDGWEDVFRQCGAVAPCDQDDKAAFQKYKYAVGRNWDAVMSAIKFCQKELRKALEPSPEYDVFLREVDDLNREYCQKDASGQPVTKAMENGTVAFVFGEDQRALRDGLLEEIRKKHAAAIDEQKAKEEAASEYMQGEIDVPLFCVPWACIPGRIGAAYYPALSRMCTDIPADVQEMIESAPIRFVDESEIDA